MTLDEVKFNEDIVFSGFIGTHQVYVEKLSAQGLIPGAVCRLLKKIPTCGVVQLQVRDSVLGLRWKEAEQLLFEYREDDPKENSTDW